MDANKEDWRAQMSGTAQLNRIHVRRAHLLGLDAPARARRRAMIYANEVLPRPGGAEQNLIKRLTAVGRRFSSVVALVRLLPQARPHAIRA